MDIFNITSQLLFGVVISSLIGLNREAKSSPAGLKTYNLVCLGSVILTIVATQMKTDAINIIAENYKLASVINIDTSKIIAQIVSGIGFLGAGTIIFNQKKVSGLSTASSLWVTAAIGIAVGLKYYLLATISSIFVVIILMFINKLVPIRSIKKISITFLNKEDELLITQYFTEREIVVKKIESRVFSESRIKYINDVFTVMPKKNLDIHEHILMLGQYQNIITVELVDV